MATGTMQIAIKRADITVTNIDMATIERGWYYATIDITSLLPTGARPISVTRCSSWYPGVFPEINTPSNSNGRASLVFSCTEHRIIDSMPLTVFYI